MKFPALYAMLNKPDLIAATGKDALPFYYQGDSYLQSPLPPYIVWSTPSGIEPSLYLSCPSDSDRYGVQIDFYSRSAQTTAAIAGLIRKHLHVGAEVTFIRLDYEPDTKLHRAIIEADVFINNSWSN